MAIVSINIPDELVALYNVARASWNPYIAAQGGNLLPAPSKTALEQLLKNYIKRWILSEALRTEKTDAEVDALQAQLNAL
jgi:hypothetical protein